MHPKLGQRISAHGNLMSESITLHSSHPCRRQRSAMYPRVGNFALEGIMLHLQPNWLQPKLWQRISLF
jgi:hypothetical protein